jgi:hypothetical protein
MSRLRPGETSVWSASPAHQRVRSHLVEDIDFAELGCDSTIKCDCDWSAVCPTHEGVERAYWQHRRDMGLPATIMTITTPLARVRG